MAADVTVQTICARSELVISREIGGEVILAAISGGVADLEDGVFSLNETAKEIWTRFDGEKSLGEIAAEIAGDFDAPLQEVERDVVELAVRLFDRRLITHVS
jgi:hypothetical protein